jgi:GH18 family chitinase
MTYNESSRIAIYTWRQNNIEKYREQQKFYQRERYKTDYENTRQEQKKRVYRWNKQTKILLDMLNNLYPL